MLNAVLSVYSLLLAICILLLGSGLLGTVIGLRAGLEGFSNTVTGIVMSAFFVGYIIGAYLCPRLVRSVGYIRAYSVFAAIAAVAMILHGLIIDAFVWWWLRIISGVCVMGLYMIIESWLNSMIKEHPKRGRIFSVYMMITLASLGAGQYFLLLYGPSELASFALGAIFFILSLVPVAVTRLSQPVNVSVPRMMLRKLVKASPLGAAGAFCSGLASGAFWGMGALYARGMGFDSSGIAIFISAIVFGGVLLQYPIGHQSDLHDRRSVLTVVSIVSALVAGVAFLVTPAIQPLFLGIVLLYGGVSFSVYSLSVAHTQDQVTADQVLDVTRSLLLLNGTGAALGPVVAGVMMQQMGDGSLMLCFSLVFLLLALFAIYRHLAGEPIPEEAQEGFVSVTRTSPEIIGMNPRADNSHQ
ncbi:MAG: MFS transporter [Gammaproteobacteria bacterium]|nr:MFS transporter [Gammaproteobacteria bacterium]